MAQINEELKTSEERVGNETLTSDEWTIIGEKESSDNISFNGNQDNNINSNDDIDDDNEMEEEEENVAEEAREAIKVLGEKLWSETTGGEESLKPETSEISDLVAEKEDDSDGVLVITETENNNDSFCNCISKMIMPQDNFIITPLTLFQIIIACLLAIMIGFGIGWYSGPGKTQMSSNDVNFKPTKSKEFPNDVNKLNVESLITLDLNPESVLVEPKIILDEYQKPIVNVEYLNDVFSLRKILKNIDIFLNAICTMIINENDYIENTEYVCNHQSSLVNLINLKVNLENIIKLTKSTKENSNQRFVDNMESRIENISLSFVADLSRSIKSSVTKIDRKLNKLKYKLYQRICLIENTMGDDLHTSHEIMKLKNLGINCTENFQKDKLDVKLKIKLENKKFNKPEEKYSHPIGPEVKRNNEQKNEKMESKNYRDTTQSNVKIIDYNREESKKKFKQQKYREKTKKYDNDENILEYDESKPTNEMNVELIQDIPRLKFDKFKHNSKNSNKHDNKNVCHKKSCLNQKNKDRKYSQERSESNWQFKRSEGRNNWRRDKKSEDEVISWDHDRAKARESARLKY